MRVEVGFGVGVGVRVGVGVGVEVRVRVSEEFAECKACRVSVDLDSSLAA